MPHGLFKKLLFVLSVSGACSASFAQLKSNDFTKANNSFSRSAKPLEKSRLNDEKSRMSDEKYTSKTFKPEDNAGYLRDKTYRGTDSAVADDFSKQTYYREGEKAYVPERTAFQQKWTGGENPHFDNKDRILNKDYEGRSDFSKRHPRDAEMRAFYENMQERSMQDINKYQFRSSHSSDPGIPVTVAGSQLRGDEAKETSFVEDLVFGRKTLNRTPLSLKKNIDVGTISTKSSPDGSDRISESVAPMPAAAPGQVKVLPAKVVGETQKSNLPPEKKTTVYEGVSEKVLFVPDPDEKVKRSKTKIKVEIKDQGY